MPDPTIANLTIGLLNARSISAAGRVPKILSEMLSHNIDFTFFTETWHKTNDDIHISELTPTGFQNYFQPRPNYKTGGGLGVVFPDVFSVTIIDLPHFTCFEQFTFTVNYSTLPQMTFTLIYRPPSSSQSTFQTEFEDLLEFTMNCRNLIILGDFNIHADRISDSFTANYLNLIHHFGLKQHVTGPTHTSGHTLDLIMSRLPDDIDSVTSVHDCDISDHSLVTFTLSFPKPTRSPHRVSCRDWKAFNMDDFKYDLCNTALFSSQQIIAASSVSLAVSEYNTTLVQLIDKHAPLVTKTVFHREPVPWFNANIRTAIQKRRKLEAIWRKTRSPSDRSNFVNQRNYVKTVVNSSKHDYYVNFVTANCNDPKRFWSSLNRLLHRRKITSLPAFDSPIQAADSFANFFTDKINTIRQQFSPSCSYAHHRLHNVSLSDFSPVTTAEVLSVLRATKPKSCPLDPIPTWIVISLADVFAPILCHIANLSLRNGELPLTEKRAIITPLLKKKGLDKENLKNYRPVSGLTFLSKLIEKLVASRIDMYLSINNLLNPFQSAYRTGYSTESVLVRLHNDVITAHENGRLSVIAFLDLSAAFDTVDHTLLLERLEHSYGLTDTVLAWFTSYMTGRTQSVRISNVNSSSHAISCGVPQGSVPGPRLYTLYSAPISDIIRTYNVDHMIYADDTCIYIVFHYDDRENYLCTIESCLHHLEDWFNSSRLCLNPDKTEVLLCPPSLRFNISNVRLLNISGNIIPYTTNVKHLGVYLDHYFTFDDHIKHICQTSFGFIRSVYHIRRYLDEDTTKLLVTAFVNSRLDYCNSILNGCTLAQIQRLQRIQNCCARLVLKLPRMCPTSDAIRKLHWLPIRQRITFKLCCLVHNCIYGNAPSYLSELLAPAPSAGIELSLRSQAAPCLLEPRYHYSTSRGAFSFAAPRLWNHLPPQCRCVTDHVKFRRALKTELFNL